MYSVEKVQYVGSQGINNIWHIALCPENTIAFLQHICEARGDIQQTVIKFAKLGQKCARSCICVCALMHAVSVRVRGG